MTSSKMAEKGQYYHRSPAQIDPVRMNGLAKGKLACM